jgi:hypothetical protein
VGAAAARSAGDKITQESRPRLPCRYGSTPERRIVVEMVEADIEIGFRLVDVLESWPAEKSRLAAAIEDVYADVLARLDRLQTSERESFGPLVTELRRAINLALPPASTG